MLFILGSFVKCEGFYQQNEALRRTLLEVSSGKNVAAKARLGSVVRYARSSEVMIQLNGQLARMQPLPHSGVYAIQCLYIVGSKLLAYASIMSLRSLAFV
jgi:hypothetical protein